MRRSKKYVAVKVVDNRLIGATVGPFNTEDNATRWAELATQGSFGHERWIVQELQHPTELERKS